MPMVARVSIMPLVSRVSMILEGMPDEVVGRDREKRISIPQRGMATLQQ